LTAQVEDGKIRTYKTTVRLTFGIGSSPEEENEMSQRWLVLIVAVGCAVFGAACQQDSGDAGASLEKHAEQAAEAVEDMAAKAEDAAETLDAEAKALYDTVAAELEEKKGELEAVKEKIAGMNPEDLMSSAGNALKDSAEELTGEIATLQEKLEGLTG